MDELMKWNENSEYVIQELIKACMKDKFDDEYLESIGNPTRKNKPMILNDGSGILYLRDDAALDLLAAINQYKIAIDKLLTFGHIYGDKIKEQNKEIERLNNKINDMRVQLLFARGK